MKLIAIVILGLVSLALAQSGVIVNVANFPDPPFFPGNGLDTNTNYPQNAGGGDEAGIHYPPIGAPDAVFFNEQPELAANNGWTTGLGGGLTGAYPGQITNFGVDPVRGIVVGANLNKGSSSASGGHGRSGKAAGSSNGFGIAETKWPDRINIHTTDFIDVKLNAVSVSAGSHLIPTLLAILVIALLF